MLTGSPIALWEFESITLKTHMANISKKMIRNLPKVNEEHADPIFELRPNHIFKYMALINGMYDIY